MLRFLIGWALCSLVLLVNAWSSLESVVDDAFISGRYAAHGAAGHGWVYNAGQPAIEGFSNALWTFWLGLTLWFGFELHATMVWSGLFFGVCALGALAFAARQYVDHHWAAWIPVLLLAVDPHFGVVITNGLESGMYMALLFLCVGLVFREDKEHSWVLGLVIGLLWATRPEGLVAAVGLNLYVLWKKPLRCRASWSIPIACGLVWILILAWRFTVYADVLPNTAAAKATGDIWGLWAKNWRYIQPESWFWGVVLILGVVGAMCAPKDKRTALLVFLIVSSTAIASQVYLWMPGARLLLTPMALCFLLMTWMLQSLRLRWIGIIAATTFGAACVVSPVRARVLRQDHIHSVVRDNDALQVARYLSTKLPEGAWVATRDAGVLAYGLGTTVRVAELHPRALTQRHKGGQDADPNEYVPDNPEVFIFTTNRKGKSALYYSMERKVFGRRTMPYRYLGRVYQHYHRYYDVVVREDIPIETLPEQWVVNRALVMPIKRGVDEPKQP